MTSNEQVYLKARNRYRWLLLLFGLLLAGVIILTSQPLFDKPYPNLGSFLPFFSFIGIPILVMIFFPLFQTLSIELTADYVIVRKGYGKVITIAYTDIIGFAERTSGSREKSQQRELAIYSSSEWFTIQQQAFPDYSILKDTLTQYGKPVAFQQSFSKTERSLVNSLLLFITLLMVFNIGYGFAAHTPSVAVGKVPLRFLEGTINQLKVNEHKGTFKGIAIQLHSHNEFVFYARKNNFDKTLRLIPQYIFAGSPVRLTIRASDYDKKIAHTTPLFLGDKFDQYNQIELYGIESQSLQLKAIGEIKEDMHTSPTLWLFGGLAGLLLVWTGCVFLDKHQLRQILR